MRSALVGAAAICGIVAGYFLSNTTACHEIVGRFSSRGGIIAVIDGRAFYETDARVRGGNFESVISDAAVDAAAKRSDSMVEETQTRDATKLLRSQARDETMWQSFLHDSGLNDEGVHQLAADWLRARTFVEPRVGSAVRVSDEDCHGFYDKHRAFFVIPVRIRAQHIFLAAPQETAPEIVAAKQRQMKEIAAALAGGADFGKVAAAVSEDEATKNRDGDLGWLSGRRTPADFLAGANKLRVGQTSGVIRTSLGFHIVRITDVRPSRELTFEDVHKEIELSLRNIERERIARELAKEFVRRFAGIAD